ncbi:MAG TPA: energy transducer TonB [Vicinamibacterales bacterium]|jgi:protein TonB
MRVGHLLLACGLSLVVAGCGAPPTTDVDAARASIDKATATGASQYASASLKEAQDAQAALDAELKAQDGKWFRSYDKARELAAAAKNAGDKAATEAADAKDKAMAKAAAAKKREEARVAAKAAAVRVGGPVRPPVKIKDVPPIYPEIAKQAKVSGAVVIEATIDKDGKVADTKVVKSAPLLEQAAVDAVRQWEYKPSMQNGKPVPVVMTVTVNFTR